MDNILKNGLLVVLSVVVSLLASEAIVRIIDGQPVFALRNWVMAKAVHSLMGGSNQYDPVLGWRLREGIQAPLLNTGVLGLRKTNGNDIEVQPGQVLAVGDSFTAGSEVKDHESWPAQFSVLLKRPVYNAGVGAYGTDQIILHAEDLVRRIAPATWASK